MAIRQMSQGLTGFPLLAEAASLITANEFEQAGRLTMEHLRKHPNEPRGLAQLGTIALGLGALGQAEHFCRLALRNGATAPQVKRDLASILNQQERLDEAHSMFEALLHEEDNRPFSAILAVIKDKLGLTEEAMRLRQLLAEQEPENPFYWIAYGHSLRAAGRVDDAVKAYRTATEVDFECGEAWWGLASIKNRVFTDDDIAQMRRAIAIAIDTRNSAPAHFALARALHDRAEYAEAFEHYAIANRQRADSLGYNADELTAEVDEVKKSVTPQFAMSLTRQAANDEIPIFIVSLPRSGSTLLEQMLGSHADIEPVGELPYIPALLRTAIELATRHGQITVPQLIARMDDRQANALGVEYLRRVKLHRKTESRFFIDKLPHNWSNVLFIRRILPQARFIDIRRSAMDCCFSNFTQSFSAAHASSFTLEDIGQCYADYVRFMAHLDKVAPNMVHHVAYKRLVEDAETELRTLIAYLDLPWDAAMLDFHQLKRVVRTPSSEQVRRPLNRDGMDIWAPYSEWLEPLRRTLGTLADSA